MILTNVTVQEITFQKRSTEDLEKMRQEFNSTKRKEFLKELGKDVEALKKAGFSDEDIETIQSGKVPSGWQVHHKIPLDGGGTNSYDNLVLILNEPYHKVLTNYQNSVTKGMDEGDSKTIEWPIPNGSIYPATH